MITPVWIYHLWNNSRIATVIEFLISFISWLFQALDSVIGVTRLFLTPLLTSLKSYYLISFSISKKNYAV